MNAPPKPDRATITSICHLCGREEQIIFIREPDKARRLYFGVGQRHPLVRYCGLCEVEMKSRLRFDP